MKSTKIFGILFLFFLQSCLNSPTPEERGENDVDAARIFIQAALNGEYDKARKLMISDSMNTAYLDAAERNYQSRMSREDKRGYRESSLRLQNVRQVGDSVTIISYSNSYRNQKDSLKLVKVKGQWLVDLKYSFNSGDSSQITNNIRP